MYIDTVVLAPFYDRLRARAAPMWLEFGFTDIVPPALLVGFLLLVAGTTRCEFKLFPVEWHCGPVEQGAEKLTVSCVRFRTSKLVPIESGCPEYEF